MTSDLNLICELKLQVVFFLAVLVTNIFSTYSTKWKMIILGRDILML